MTDVVQVFDQTIGKGCWSGGDIVPEGCIEASVADEGAEVAKRSPPVLADGEGVGVASSLPKCPAHGNTGADRS